MKKLLIALFMTMAITVSAQNDPFMYQYNYLLYNPAYSGSENKASALGSYTHQNFPNNFYGDQNQPSYNGIAEINVNRIHSAFGIYKTYGTIYPNDLQSIGLAYNYEIKITSELKVRLGGAFKQIKSDFNQFYYATSAPVYSGDFGMWMNYKKTYFGLGTINTFEPVFTINITPRYPAYYSDYTFQQPLKRQYSLAFGHEFKINDFFLTPSSLMLLSSDLKTVSLGFVGNYKHLIYIGYNLWLSNHNFTGNYIHGGFELLRTVQLMGYYSLHQYYNSYGFMLRFKKAS
jgi:hypothetical protein